MIYDVKAMKSDLDLAVKVVEQTIQESFKKAFQTIYENNLVPESFDKYDVKIVKKEISAFSDFKGIPSRSGFYIILTNCPIDGNECRLKYGDLTAVYRGQASTAKRRLTSHLFNRRYNELYDQRKNKYLKDRNDDDKYYEVHFGACMKFNPKINGINITDTEYKDYKWMVITHEMLNSSERVRELAELGFDDAFKKPIASRE